MMGRALHVLLIMVVLTAAGLLLADMKAAAIGARGGRGAQSAYLCNTSDLALLQADEFFRLKSTHRLWTQCPTQGWTEALRSALQPAAADGSSSSPRPSRLVFFDVGCNKGYESARLLDVFVPGSGLDPPSLYALYKKRQAAARPGEPRFETLCGSCDNCKEKSEATGVSSRRAATMKSQHVEIHCFEPGGANFRLLQAAHSHFFPNDTSSRMGGSSSAEVASGGGSSNSSNLLGFSRSSLSSQTVVGMAIAEVGVYDGTGVILSRRSAAGTATRFNSQPQSTENVSAPPPPSSSSSTISARWVLHNAAAGDVDGSVKFPADCRTTRCRIGKRDIDSGSSGLVDVRALTIDRFALDNGIQHIDILKVDAEGHDPRVLAGAARLLKSRRVGVLYFEYHKLGAWQTTDLKDVVEQLDGWGYACYLDGQPTLTRLDSGCWDSRYEFKDWSNVVCVGRRHPAFDAIDRMSVARQMQLGGFGRQQ